MIDTSEQKLTGQFQPRGLPLGGGGCTAAFGAPFLLAGLGVMAFGFYGQHEEPGWVIASAGLVFAAAGGFLVGSGLRGSLAARRHARWKSEHPREPWLGDHPWDRTGASAHGASGVFGCLSAFTVLVLILAPWGASLAHDAWEDEAFRRAFGENPVAALAEIEEVPWLVALLGCPLAFVLLTVGWAIAHRIRYGRGRLHFQTFPFFLGEPLEGRLRLRGPSGGFDRLTVTLRFLQDRAEVETSGARRSNTINVYQVWADARVHERAALPRGRTIELWLRFTPPEDPRYETRLSGLPPQYWIVDVQGEAPGIDLRAQFLVPVYARPGSAVSVS